MPYAFAHPAAVILVARLLGPRGVPSALAIGSMIPDIWYLLPFIERDQTHSLAGALLVCLPAGLALYAAFHLIFKQPMLALLPRGLAGRLAAWTVPGAPKVAARWVLVSLLAGMATHLAWDAFTHSDGVGFVRGRIFGEPLHRILQHASTALGSAFLAWWISCRLARILPVPDVPTIGEHVRIAVLATMLLAPAAAFLGVLDASSAEALRVAARAAGVTAFSAFGLVALSFSIAWRYRRT